MYITLEKRIKILLSHYPMQYIYANNLIHVGLILSKQCNWSSCFCDTSIQGTQNLAPENVHIVFVSITSIKGKSDLYSEEKDTFSGSGNLALLTSIISGNTSALKKWLTTKRADIVKCTLIKNGSFSKLNYLT